MMRFAGFGLISCLVATAPAPSFAQAEASPDMARRFGVREEVEQASLSPDGTKAAFIQPETGQGSAVYIVDLLGNEQFKPVRILTADGRPNRLSSCRWTSTSRLLCTVYALQPLATGDFGYASRVIAVDSDGGGMKLIENRRGTGRALGISLHGGDVIDWNAGQEGHVLMVRQYIPEETVGTRGAQTKEGLGVDDIDTVTLRATAVVRPRKDAREYISDGKGTVRIVGDTPSDASGYDREGRRYFFRRKGADSWEPLSTVDMNGNGFDPHRVDPALDLAYGIDRKDGRRAAFSKALDGSGKETLLFAHPQVDIDGFVTIGRDRRTIGVSYATDRREVHYFDPAIEKLAGALSKALPHAPLIRVVDASDDEQKLLIWAGSDVDPGRYYLLDRASGRMEIVTASRPQLEGMTLAPVKAVTYPAGDGTMIPAYLTLPPGKPATGLPAIVLPHGGPGARDEWGFDWLSQYYASLGYAVLQPNFRGSTGYGDAWFQKNGFQSWKTAIADVDDGGRWLVSQGIARADGLAVVGWSYGGYAALQSAVTEPKLFRAVIAIAPVTDLERLREDRREWSDFQNVSRYIGSGPHIEEGSPARHAGAIKAPVLMFHGTLDRNVGVGHARMMDDRLRKAGGSSELVVYEGLDHYLEDSAARIDMLTRSAAFLAKALQP